jgi:hypothetical protein
MNVPSETSTTAIRTVRRPSCALCGNPGILLHGDLADTLFGVPGRWEFKRCESSDCGLVWLDPYPAPGDLCKAYEGYHTHHRRPAPSPRSRLQRLIDHAKRGYLATTFGYGSVTAAQKLLGFLVYLQPTRRADLDFSVMRLEALPYGRLLDVGCGSGEFLRTMHDLRWQVQGTDLDAEAVRTARLDSDISVFQGTLYDAQFPADSLTWLT